MPNPRVLCLGEILFDCLADRAGQTLEEVQSWIQYPGGAPANVACALAKLGTPAAFIGCVGSDEAGNVLINILQEIGVSVEGVQRHPSAPTRKIYVLRSANGDRSFAGFGNIPTTSFADTFLHSDQLPEELFANAEYLVLGTLELAYPETSAAINKALELAEKYYLKILVDINWRPMFWPEPALAVQKIYELIQYVDFLKLSDTEAEWLFATTDPTKIAERIGHIEGVLVTAGEKGCAYYLSETEGKIPAFSVIARDTTGAGDGFFAGFIHQLCQHGIKNLYHPELAKSIVRYSSAVGALTTTQLGAIAAQPNSAEVEAFLAYHQEF